MGTDDLHQAGARTHRVAQLDFEMTDQLERLAVILVDGPKVSIRRKDAHPARKPAQVAARRSVLVILGDIHRMKPDGVYPVPGEYIRQRLVEDWKPVVDRSIAGCKARIHSQRR